MASILVYSSGGEAKHHISTRASLLGDFYGSLAVRTDAVEESSAIPPTIASSGVFGQTLKAILLSELNTNAHMHMHTVVSVSVVCKARCLRVPRDVLERCRAQCVEQHKTPKDAPLGMIPLTLRIAVLLSAAHSQNHQRV